MFEDFHFKLVVIDALLDQEPLFQEELTNLINTYTNDFEWYSGAGPIIEIMNFFKEVALETKDLEKVEYLCFDGGNEIYHILKPDWDGEDCLFEVSSAKGFQHLINLKTVDYMSMCDPKVLKPLESAGIEVRY